MGYEQGYDIICIDFRCIDVRIIETGSKFQLPLLFFFQQPLSFSESSVQLIPHDCGMCHRQFQILFPFGEANDNPFQFGSLCSNRFQGSVVGTKLALGLLNGGTKLGKCRDRRFCQTFHNALQYFGTIVQFPEKCLHGSDHGLESRIGVVQGIVQKGVDLQFGFGNGFFHLLSNSAGMLRYSMVQLLGQALHMLFRFDDPCQELFDCLPDRLHFGDLFLHLAGPEFCLLGHCTKLSEHLMVIGQGLLQFIEIL